MKRLHTKRVTTQSTGYPPLKNDTDVGTWRKIPWINFRGFWLEQAEFAIGTHYTTETHDKKLIFTVIQINGPANAGLLTA